MGGGSGVFVGNAVRRIGVLLGTGVGVFVGKGVGVKVGGTGVGDGGTGVKVGGTGVPDGTDVAVGALAVASILWATAVAVPLSDATVALACRNAGPLRSGAGVAGWVQAAKMSMTMIVPCTRSRMDCARIEEVNTPQSVSQQTGLSDHGHSIRRIDSDSNAVPVAIRRHEVVSAAAPRCTLTIT